MSFRETFRSLPVEAQDAILDELLSALLWRGWDSMKWAREGETHAEEHVNNIADICAANGKEIDEYT